MTTPNTAASAARNYWIGVVSKSTVDQAVAGGYTQLSNGKAGPLERMREGDGFAFYSPRVQARDGDRVQAFTAIGRIADGPIFQADTDPAERPFRRRIEYLSSCEAPTKPLIEPLSFVRNKAHWGVAFRFGFVKVPEADFARIAAAMGREFARDFPL